MLNLNEEVKVLLEFTLKYAELQIKGNERVTWRVTRRQPTRWEGKGTG